MFVLKGHSSESSTGLYTVFIFLGGVPHMACGISVPQSGIEPTQANAVLTTRLPGKS